MTAKGKPQMRNIRAPNAVAPGMIVTLIRPREPETDWMLAPEDGSEPERLSLGPNEFLTLEMVMGGSDRVRVHAVRAGDGWDILRRVQDA